MARQDLLVKTQKAQSAVKQEMGYLGSDKADVFPEEDFSPESISMEDMMPEVIEEPPEDSVEFSVVMEGYWQDMISSIGDHPVLKLYLAGVYKMAQEYTRMKDTIEDMNSQIMDLGTDAKLTNERSRLRDNIASLTTEGWKMMDAVLGNLNRIQTFLEKNKKDSGPVDLFDAMQGGE